MLLLQWNSSARHYAVPIAKMCCGWLGKVSVTEVVTVRRARGRWKALAASRAEPSRTVMRMACIAMALARPCHQARGDATRNVRSEGDGR